MASQITASMDGTLLNWLKNVGENVNKGDVIAEVEADKEDDVARRGRRLRRTQRRRVRNAGDPHARNDGLDPGSHRLRKDDDAGRAAEEEADRAPPQRAAFDFVEAPESAAVNVQQDRAAGREAEREERALAPEARARSAMHVHDRAAVTQQ